MAMSQMKNIRTAESWRKKSRLATLLAALRKKIHQLFLWEEVEVTFTNNPISSYSYKKVDQPIGS